MAGIKQETKSAITLKGSADIISEFLGKNCKNMGAHNIFKLFCIICPEGMHTINLYIIQLAYRFLVHIIIISYKIIFQIMA